jgi:hypothetical protein
MDASAAVPVELPAMINEEPTAKRPVAPYNHNGACSAYAPGMTANLDGLGQDGSRPAYINHWEQYKDTPGR